jgi:hypothetical protein
MYLYLAVNRMVLEKYGLLAVELHGVTTQKVLLMGTTVRISNPEFFLFANMYRVFRKSRTTGFYLFYMNDGF